MVIVEAWEIVLDFRLRLSSPCTTAFKGKEKLQYSVAVRDAKHSMEKNIVVYCYSDTFWRDGQTQLDI